MIGMAHNFPTPIEEHRCVPENKKIDFKFPMARLNYLIPFRWVLTQRYKQVAPLGNVIKLREDGKQRAIVLNSFEVSNLKTYYSPCMKQM